MKYSNVPAGSNSTRTRAGRSSAFQKLCGAPRGISNRSFAATTCSSPRSRTCSRPSSISYRSVSCGWTCSVAPAAFGSAAISIRSSFPSESAAVTRKVTVSPVTGLRITWPAIAIATAPRTPGRTRDTRAADPLSPAPTTPRAGVAPAAAAPRSRARTSPSRSLPGGAAKAARLRARASARPSIARGRRGNIARAVDRAAP